MHLIQLTIVVLVHSSSTTTTTTTTTTTNILLCKLSLSDALNWLKDYLSNRIQYVVVNGVSTNLRIISCGIQQGSVIGLLLFILYINDVTYSTKHVLYIVS